MTGKTVEIPVSELEEMRGELEKAVKELGISEDLLEGFWTALQLVGEQRSGSSILDALFCVRYPREYVAGAVRSIERYIGIANGSVVGEVAVHEH